LTTKLLILGATGMLGNAMVRFLAGDPRLAVVGAARSPDARGLFPAEFGDRIVGGLDLDDGVAGLFADHGPDVVINCVGVIKQRDEANDVLASVPINTLLPHRLVALCKEAGARLIHFSTDCVFSGSQGDYRESDPPDARDLYGLGKLLGETAAPHAITLRTSMVGHELRGRRSLLEWFLAQSGSARGYRRAVFSGLPTVELARIVRDHVIPRPDLHGLYHVSAGPIAKFDLLKLIAAVYERDIEIVPDEALVIDRSLNSDRFRAATGYDPPSWPELVAEMRRFG
jgi:dTDP-4-dehydrorhamnose reductase